MPSSYSGPTEPDICQGCAGVGFWEGRTFFSLEGHLSSTSVAGLKWPLEVIGRLNWINSPIQRQTPCCALTILEGVSVCGQMFVLSHRTALSMGLLLATSSRGWDSIGKWGSDCSRETHTCGGCWGYGSLSLPVHFAMILKLVCVYVSVCMWVYTQIVCMHVYVHVVYMCVMHVLCVCLCVCVCMCVYIYACCICLCICMYVCVCICMYACDYVSMHVCLCLYVYVCM